MLCFIKNTDGACWLRSEYPVVQIRFKWHIPNRWGENEKVLESKRGMGARERGGRSEGKEIWIWTKLNKNNNNNLNMSESWGVPPGSFSALIRQERVFTYSAWATFCQCSQSNRNRLAEKHNGSESLLYNGHLKNWRGIPLKTKQRKINALCRVLHLPEKPAEI